MIENEEGPHCSIICTRGHNSGHSMGAENAAEEEQRLRNSLSKFAHSQKRTRQKPFNMFQGTTKGQPRVFEKDCVKRAPDLDSKWVTAFSNSQSEPLSLNQCIRS